jgi:hypothetical protein
MMSIPSVCSRLWEIIINCWSGITSKAGAVTASGNALMKGIEQAQPGILNQQWFSDTKDALEKAETKLDEAKKLIDDRQASIVALTPST